MSHPWRTHPRLQGRFHPEYPDDLQVLAHDGGPEIAANPPELVWVRVTGMAGGVFTGRVLNAPQTTQGVREGDTIRFLAPEASEYAILATEKYLRERGDWTIHPCLQCGLTELFDAPSDLIRKQFPDRPGGSLVEAFVVRCPLCLGTIALERKPGVSPT
jgi:hypothetical protein